MQPNNKIEQSTAYLKAILVPLTKYPEDIKIIYQIDERGLLLDLTANDRDLSRIIGKHGINAWSLRNILRVWGQMNDAVLKLTIKGRGLEFYEPRRDK